jgi:hypothetical protein
MEQVKDYELKAFFYYVIEVLEQLNIPYMVVGGFAAIFYGEPRFTLDVDIVADVKLHHISKLANMFPFPEYYLSEEGIRDSLIRCYPFNIIQPTTGAKVDIVPMPSDSFTRAAFKRRQRKVCDETGRTAMFITPEDIIIAKLVAFSRTGSDKHLRDARGILVTLWEQLDLERIKTEASAINLDEQLGQLQQMVSKEVKEE